MPQVNLYELRKLPIRGHVLANEVQRPGCRVRQNVADPRFGPVQAPRRMGTASTIPLFSPHIHDTTGLDDIQAQFLCPSDDRIVGTPRIQPHFVRPLGGDRVQLRQR